MKKIALLIIVLAFISCKKDSDPEIQSPAYEINTEQAVNITNNSAWISGSISNIENAEISNYGHVWSVNQNPTTESGNKTEFYRTNSDTTFTSKLSDLKKKTTYYIRPYITDNTGTYYGDQISFTTNDQFFKFIVSSDYMSYTYDLDRTWIIIYSENGDLVDYLEIFNGETYEINWPVNPTSDKYNIQILKEKENGSPDADYNIDCYLGVYPNNWYIGQEPHIKPEPIGTNTVSINGFDDDYYYATRNTFDYGYYSNIQNQMVYNQKINPDKIMITYQHWFEEEPPYYIWLDNVGINESYSFNLSDLTEMTDYIEVDFQGLDIGIIYIESEDDLSTDYWEWYEVYLNINENYDIRKKAYYPGNLFNGYFSYLTAYSNNTRERMIKRRGSVPDQFVSLPSNINIIDNSIYNLEVEIINETEVIELNWEKYENLNSDSALVYRYTIHGSKEDINTYELQELPSEITVLLENEYDYSRLEYKNTIFRKYDNVDSFDEYINFIFVFLDNYPGDNMFIYSKEIREEGKSMDIEVDFRKDIQRIRNNPYLY